LRRIDEAVWRSEIDIVQSVEKLRAELEPKSFTQSELAHDCHVECLADVIFADHRMIDKEIGLMKLLSRCCPECPKLPK
jgi:hypothetical protein